MVAIEIRFDAASEGTIARAAQEARNELVREGFEPDRVSVRRTDKESMNIIDTVMTVLSDPIHVAAVTVEVAAIANTIYHICRREKTGVHLRRGDIDVFIAAADMQLDNVVAICDRIAKDVGNT